MHAILNFDTVAANMNIGLGYDQTINDYYRTAAEVIGYKGEFFNDISKPVGMARKLISVGRQNTWGWTPLHTLHVGI